MRRILLPTELKENLMQQERGWPRLRRAKKKEEEDEEEDDDDE